LAALVRRGLPVKTRSPWEFDDSLPEPVQAEWSLVTFSMQRDDRSEIEVEMIRPTSFWEQQAAVPGAKVFLEFPELEVSTYAKVRKVEPSPPIAAGSGNVVTARIVTLKASDLVELTLETGETLTGTPPHPIWSVERQDWVELGEIEVGEHLQTADGAVEITAFRLLNTGETVYNLEVHGHHIYQVSELGVLVHNASGLSAYKVNKNSNKARGTFAIYEIFVNGTLRKVGKAAANAERLTKKGIPSRLASQLRRLERIYGQKNVKGEVVETLKNSSTRLAKVRESARIAKRVAENTAAGKVGKNAIPHGHRRSYRP
jgi:hypothetical protein